MNCKLENLAQNERICMNYTLNILAQCEKHLQCCYDYKKYIFFHFLQCFYTFQTQLLNEWDSNPYFVMHILKNLWFIILSCFLVCIIHISSWGFSPTFSIKICKVLYTEYMNIIIIYKTFKIAYKFSNTAGKKYSLWISAAADRMDKYN